MKVLGIETSCDETSAALVEDGRAVLSNVIHSQEAKHAPFRGIVPEIASREHVGKVNEVVSRALRDGKLRPDALAVTIGPGLVGSLLVGKMTAEALGWMWELPVVGVNHLEAHALSPMLESPELKPPFLALVVSGGHTDLIHVVALGRYRVLGRTRDDAAGESFDKVAKLLGLGYPGGPAIEAISRSAAGDPIPLPRPHLRGSWDFSFSGLKTAVLYLLRDSDFDSLTRSSRLRFAARVSAAFQDSVVEVLVEKSISAAKSLGLTDIAVGGGVSANSVLRARLSSRARAVRLRAHFPSKELSTDNAAMVAAAGYHRLKAAQTGRGGAPLRVDPSLPFSSWR